jgi:hypothetical protein
MSLDFYFEFLSFILSILFFRHLKNASILLFVPFLFLTVLIEFVGWCYHFFKIANKNYWIFNLFTTIELVFYAYLFSINFKNATLKKIATYFIPLLIIISILNYRYLQGTAHFHTYTLLFGSFFMVIFCCVYLYELIITDAHNENLFKQPFFWICIGIFLFYLGSVIINSLFEYMLNNNLLSPGNNLYLLITRGLNMVLYSSFSISFILCNKNKKTYYLPL